MRSVEAREVAEWTLHQLRHAGIPLPARIKILVGSLAAFRRPAAAVWFAHERCIGLDLSRIVGTATGAQATGRVVAAVSHEAGHAASGPTDLTDARSWP
jgi:hypothetical protein